MATTALVTTFDELKMDLSFTDHRYLYLYLLYFINVIVFLQLLETVKYWKFWSCSLRKQTVGINKLNKYVKRTTGYKLRLMIDMNKVSVIQRNKKNL